MYRYEVTLTIKSDIENIVGKPLFYEDTSKYYIDGNKKDVSIQYYDNITDSFLSKTLDELCQQLYSTDFSSQSVEHEYKIIDEVMVDSQPPFAAKVLPNGKKLYARTRGASFAVSTGVNTLDFDIPYPTCKITGLEIINGEVGDKVDLFILDDDLGTYSTVPNYVLNQFGFDTNIAKDFYNRESQYDADLYYNMCVSITYYSQSAKTVYINYLLHEVKD